MKKTLILAVDRDNDFGAKAGVVTPVVGIEGCVEAAVALGVKDPEDSDVNGVFAAINRFKELQDDGEPVEIALICGDQKVGHRSDKAIISELDEVLERVKPDTVILVGDGAEDENITPIISSRVPIDSVRKVFVKQVPGIEGTLYIFKKMIQDPQKRKRFLVPLGGLMLLIGMIFLFEGVFAYFVTDDVSYIYRQTWSVIAVILGLMLVLYGYNVMDMIVDALEDDMKNIKSGDITVTFTILSLLMVIIGICMGFYSVWDIRINDKLYFIVTFITTAMWPIIFAIVFRDSGKVLKNYLSFKKVNRSFMIGTNMVIALGFIIQGGLDMLRRFLGYAEVSNGVIMAEIIIGIVFAVITSILQSTFSRYFKSLEEEPIDENQ